MILLPFIPSSKSSSTWGLKWVTKVTYWIILTSQNYICCSSIVVTSWISGLLITSGQMSLKVCTDFLPSNIRGNKQKRLWTTNGQESELTGSTSYCVSLLPLEVEPLARSRFWWWWWDWRHHTLSHQRSPSVQAFSCNSQSCRHCQCFGIEWVARGHPKVHCWPRYQHYISLTFSLSDPQRCPTLGSTALYLVSWLLSFWENQPLLSARVNPNILSLQAPRGFTTSIV